MGDPKQGPAPPTWKLMLLKWLGLFPVLLVLSYAIEWLPIDPALWVKLLITTAITVPALNFVITPWMDDTFSDWLYAGVEGGRRSVNAGS